MDHDGAHRIRATQEETRRRLAIPDLAMAAGALLIGCLQLSFVVMLGRFAQRWDLPAVTTLLDPGRPWMLNVVALSVANGTVLVAFGLTWLVRRSVRRAARPWIYVVGGCLSWATLSTLAWSIGGVAVMLLPFDAFLLWYLILRDRQRGPRGARPRDESPPLTAA